MATYTEKMIPLDDILLDPNNYRMQETPEYFPATANRFHEPAVQQKALRNLRDDSLRNLKESILTNGFVPVERIVVRPYNHAANKYLVVEGNRRIAALRWIKESHEAGVNVSEEVLAVINNVPTLLLEGGNNLTYESIMGIRHVGGIKQWGGYQRAKLIASLKDEHKLDLADIAGRLGLSTREVTRRYRAFNALQQMYEDEEFAEYATPTLYPIFHEAVATPAIKDWLNWDENTSVFRNIDQIHSFYELITPRRDDDDVEEAIEEVIPPKISNHRQVRELPSLLQNTEARAVLFDPTSTLDDALAAVRREEMSRAWKKQLAEAMEALRSIPALEVQQLNVEDVQEIQNFVNEATQLLEIQRKLTTGA